MVSRDTYMAADPSTLLLPQNKRLLLTSTTLLLSECYLIPFSFFSLPGLLGVAAYGIAFVAVIKISFDVPQTIEVVKQELNQLNTEEIAKNHGMPPLKVEKNRTSGTPIPAEGQAQDTPHETAFAIN